MGSSNIFVISTFIPPDVDESPRIAWNNLASTSTLITASHDNSNTDRLYDGMTTLAWIPGVNISSVQFDGTFLNTDYCGLAGGNWESAGCTIVARDGFGNVLGTASGMKDNQPVLFVFGKATYTQIIVEFTCTNTNLEVGEIAFGESVMLPRKVSTGYSPGRWSRNDIVTTGRTESNQFAGSIVRARGNTEQFKIGLVPTSYMETTYKDFINDATGYNIWFLWDVDYPTNSAYGAWEHQAPSFNSSLLSEINITITGVA